jgi:hypothetical protein
MQLKGGRHQMFIAGEIVYALRLLIEGIVAVFAIYKLSGKKAEWKEYIGVGLLIGILIYIVRLLPIHFGVHTLILLLFYVFIIKAIGKIEFYKATSSCIIFIAVLYLSEWITTVIFTGIFQISVETLFNKSIIGTLISFIPLAISFAVVVLMNKVKKHIKI